MSFPEDQILELKVVCPLAAIAEEGGFPFFLLPSLWLPDSASPRQVDALLCPIARDGYETRLYFAQEVQAPHPLNWNARGVRILDRLWFAHSWRVRKGLRLVQTLGEHLRAFRP